MQELKPVAWMCDANDGANADATTSERVRDDYERFGRTITPLYALPATHRIVPVALLELLEGVLSSSAYRSHHELSDHLTAIIDNKEK